MLWLDQHTRCGWTSTRTVAGLAYMLHCGWVGTHAMVGLRLLTICVQTLCLWVRVRVSVRTRIRLRGGCTGRIWASAAGGVRAGGRVKAMGSL